MDDDGTYLSAPLTFAGSLVSLPVQASADAQGVWDLELSTSLGDSAWEKVVTVFTPGTITVLPNPDIPTVSQWGMGALTLLVLTAGTLILHRQRVVPL